MEDFDSDVDRNFQKLEIPSASNSFGMISSHDMLLNYIRTLTKQDIRKLLTPIREGYLTDDTVLYLNTRNFSVDHLIVPLTIRDFLKEIHPKWSQWIHSDPSGVRSIPLDPSSPIDNPHEDFLNQEQIVDYVNRLTKDQKRSLLNLVREGLITDECFINVADHRGPERVHIPMSQVVSVIRTTESEQTSKHLQDNIFRRIWKGRHISSACFVKNAKADLDVRQLSSVRYTMPIWYTILFSLTTLGTFCSHIWSQITNFGSMSNHLQMTVPTILLIVSSCMIGALLYLVMYMVLFLICCEHNMGEYGLKLNECMTFSSVFQHFSVLHYYRRRIYITKALQFILLWYTMVLSVYAHEKDLNIYPALSCVLTNGFGLMLFARIAYFFRQCRKVMDDNAISAR